MTATFISSFQSEWLKKKRSLAVWLVVIGSLFTPAITLLIAVTHSDGLPKKYADQNFWINYWNQCWQPMSFMLLPLGIVLATSLVTQLEFKNNTWKQLHASPQSLTTIFFSKFAVLLVMMVQLFLLFNIFTFLTSVVPPLVFNDVPFPNTTIPYTQILKYNALMFLDCLPILALQYLLGLQFKNFMVPVGAGMVIWLLGTLGLSWKYSFIFPYLYSAFEQILAQGGKLHEAAPDIHVLASGYFVVIMVVAYVLYIRKADKG
jgi:lantibiotic transport system permease protein